MGNSIRATYVPAITVGPCSVCGYGYHPDDRPVWDVALRAGESVQLCDNCLDALIAVTRPLVGRNDPGSGPPPWDGLRLNAQGKPDVTPTRETRAERERELPLYNSEQGIRVTAWMAGHDHCVKRFSAGGTEVWDDSDWDAALARYRELGGDPRRK